MQQNLPRFPEVRVLNDRIVALAESDLRQQKLYNEHLEEREDTTRKNALYDQSEELGIANNEEWQSIGDAANDFLRPYGLNRD